MYSIKVKLGSKARRFRHPLTDFADFHQTICNLLSANVELSYQDQEDIIGLGSTLELEELTHVFEGRVIEIQAFLASKEASPEPKPRSRSSSTTSDSDGADYVKIDMDDIPDEHQEEELGDGQAHVQGSASHRSSPVPSENFSEANENENEDEDEDAVEPQTLITESQLLLVLQDCLPDIAKTVFQRLKTNTATSTTSAVPPSSTAQPQDPHCTESLTAINVHTRYPTADLFVVEEGVDLPPAGEHDVDIHFFVDRATGKVVQQAHEYHSEARKQDTGDLNVADLSETSDGKIGESDIGSINDHDHDVDHDMDIAQELGYAMIDIDSDAADPNFSSPKDAAAADLTLQSLTSAPALTPAPALQLDQPESADPSPKDSTAPAASEPRDLNATFVSDGNIPDGTLLAAGSSHTKQWTVKNTGADRWPNSTKLIHVKGDLATFAELPVVPAWPGESVTIQAPIQVPSTTKQTRFRSIWRLSDGTTSFGDRIWCDVMADHHTSSAPPSIELVADVPLASSPIHPNSMINKVWKLKNTGITSWPSGMRLECLTSANAQTNFSFLVPSAKPGETADVALKVPAPPSCGSFSTKWTLAHDAHGRVGPQLTLAISVEQQAPDFMTYSHCAEDDDLVSIASTTDQHHAHPRPAALDTPPRCEPAMHEPIPHVPTAQATSFDAAQPSTSTQQDDQRQQETQAHVSPLMSGSSAPRPQSIPVSEMIKLEDRLLQQLFEMGFYDRSLNRQLLAENNNDINAVIATLLQR